MATTKATKQAIKFFVEHAGFSYDPKTQTPAQGKAQCARSLARAERMAANLGFTFEWEYDHDADNSWMDEETRAENQEAFACIARDGSGNVVASLWGIFEPSREYKRVVEAELAQEIYHADRCHY
jgi:hypothetical protein